MNMEAASYTFIFAYILLVVTLLVVMIVRTLIKQRNQNLASNKFAHQINKLTDIQTIGTARSLKNDNRGVELDVIGIPSEKNSNMPAKEVKSSFKDEMTGSYNVLNQN